MVVLKHLQIDTPFYKKKKVELNSPHLDLLTWF